MRAISLLLAVVLSFCVVSLNATTINVPADQPTIQAGIDAAVDGDTVLVADGTYTGEGNRDIDFLGKAIVVMSENGPEGCIIDCEGNSQDEHRGFYFHSGEDSSSVLRGFMITNGYRFGNYDDGGGMFVEDSSPTVTYCTFSGNYAYRGGVMKIEYSSPIVTNCIFSGNSAGYSGGGMYLLESSPTVTNCTFSGNSASANGGGILNMHEIQMTVTNCILWDDFPNEIVNSYYSFSTVTFSDVQGGWTGEGNIDEDPMFVDPENGDYTLLPDSPCIDMGYPEWPCIPWGGWCLDMGAYEYDQGFYFDGQNIILKPFPFELPLTR